ncbi:ABC transporter substrate-binding protein [Arenibaculum sp.]|jgi:NitT/TauT family transport system substrate-binding protein|uniref:ABC transporter substrate-binding protein n=1 Tax=Arenibaculum sp. TaxID=2865862 RepID=UPI002E1616B2|nr:ABC transporter substrate-binding protein [Arenibaculum sp.]
MSCCDPNGTGSPVPEDRAIGRRAALKTLAGVTGGIAVASRGLPARAAGEAVSLAFCGQLLCVVPYEVTKARGHFAAEGLDVDLVYTRGGSAAVQALVGGAVDYAASSFDVAVQAFDKGARILRFASTGRLPLFALAAGPRSVAEVTDLASLAGRTLGVSALGNADHVLALYLLGQAGVDPGQVRFATLGPNLYDAVRLGQVDAGMVQEPALTLLLEAGGKVLVNVMDIDHAHRHLGGPYEFMGIAVRAEERDERLEQMRRLTRALDKGLHDTRTIPVEEVVAALPRELVAGGNRGQLVDILERHRASLYPETPAIDPESAGRVIRSLASADLIQPDFPLDRLIDRSVVEG